jgi:hypothetical protein
MMMPRPRTFVPLALARIAGIGFFLCSACVAGAPAFAHTSVTQDSPASPAGVSPATTPPSAQATPLAAPPQQLAATPLDAELLGLRMRVPVGTVVQIDRTSGPTYLLSEDSENPAWRMRVAALRASRVGTSAKSQCDDYLAELRGRGETFTVLVDEPRKVGGRDGHLFYIAVPLEQGGSGISGSLIVPNGLNEYIVCSILAVERNFAATRALLEASLGTIEFTDRMARMEERATLLGRGEALVASITPELLQSTIAPEPSFFRMWKPDDSGAQQEVGYLIVRVREGQRGEVDASRDISSLKGEERDPGLLVAVDARVIVNGDATHTLDVQSRYYVTWDRTSEVWSTRSTQRHRSAERSSAQTGIRLAPTAGSPRAKIQLIKATRDGMTRETQEWPVPPAYLSQAELVVLGQLLPRNESLTSVEFLDYAFDQREERVPQRRELWSRTERGWKLETRVGSSPDSLVQEFDRDGRRVRRVDPDGTVTERITLEELRRLWRAKGLPVD